MNNQFNKIQTHKKFKRTLIYYDRSNIKRFKRMLIYFDTDSLHIFGKIPVVKLQNDTETTDKRLKTMTNEREKTSCFG